jgi:hypothetical protein
MSLLDINNITLVGLLTISVLSIVLSSWSLDTFRKLKEKSAATDFQSKCNVDSGSVSSGVAFAGIMLAVSLIVFLYCCLSIAKKSGYIKL